MFLKDSACLKIILEFSIKALNLFLSDKPPASMVLIIKLTFLKIFFFF